MIAPADEWRCVEVSETAAAQCMAVYDLFVDLDRHREWGSDEVWSNMKIPDGSYNLERMLKGFTSKEIGACGMCLDARGMADEALVEGAHPSSVAELTTWTIWAEKVITF